MMEQNTIAGTHQGPGKKRTVAAGKTKPAIKAKHIIPPVKSKPQIPKPPRSQAETNPTTPLTDAKITPHAVSYVLTRTLDAAISTITELRRAGPATQNNVDHLE
jgi:hypothetical protein